MKKLLYLVFFFSFFSLLISMIAIKSFIITQRKTLKFIYITLYFKTYNNNNYIYTNKSSESENLKLKMFQIS